MHPAVARYTHLRKASKCFLLLALANLANASNFFDEIKQFPAKYFSGIPNIQFEYDVEGRLTHEGNPDEPTIKERMHFVHANGKFVIEELDRVSPTLPFKGLTRYTFDGSRYFFLDKDQNLLIGSRPKALNYRQGIFNLPLWALYSWSVGRDYAYSLAELTDQNLWNRVFSSGTISASASEPGTFIFSSTPAERLSNEVYFTMDLPFPKKVTRRNEDFVTTMTVDEYKTVSIDGVQYTLPIKISTKTTGMDGQAINTWWRYKINMDSIRPADSGAVFSIPIKEGRTVYDTDIGEYIKK
jgi:hypothetical protein